LPAVGMKLIARLP